MSIDHVVRIVSADHTAILSTDVEDCCHVHSEESTEMITDHFKLTLVLSSVHFKMLVLIMICHRVLVMVFFPMLSLLLDVLY